MVTVNNFGIVLGRISEMFWDHFQESPGDLLGPPTAPKEPVLTSLKPFGRSQDQKRDTTVAEKRVAEKKAQICALEIISRSGIIPPHSDKDPMFVFSTE